MDFTEKRQLAFAQLQENRRLASIGGGEKRIDAQHKRGKMTARERIVLLFDEEVYEVDAFVTHDCQHFIARQADPW